MSIQVFTPQQILDQAEKDPAFVKVTSKQDDKAFKGTKFASMKVKHGAKYAELWLSNGEGKDREDIFITRTVADPNDKEDKRNDFQGTRNKVETSVSRAGKFGQALLKLNDMYRAEVAKLKASGDIEDKPVMDILKLRYSEKHPEKEKRNQLMPDPGIRMKLDFKKHSDKYFIKHLAGMQKTTIEDWDTRRVVNGKEEFDAAKVEIDGKLVPVTEENMHHFIKRGAIIKIIRVNIGSVPRSNSGGISCPIEVSRLVIQQAPPEQFSDEAVVYDDEDGAGSSDNNNRVNTNNNNHGNNHNNNNSVNTNNNNNVDTNNNTDNTTETIKKDVASVIAGLDN